MVQTRQQAKMEQDAMDAKFNAWTVEMAAKLDKMATELRKDINNILVAWAPGNTNTMLKHNGRVNLPKMIGSFEEATPNGCGQDRPDCKERNEQSAIVEEPNEELEKKTELVEQSSQKGTLEERQEKESEEVVSEEPKEHEQSTKHDEKEEIVHMEQSPYEEIEKIDQVKKLPELKP
eukprot:Gb_18471 [translate_table: standard]